MYVVAIHSWRRETPELVKVLAEALGALPFEAQQRLIGGGPAVVGGFADSGAAQTLAQRLTRSGLPAIVFDTAALRIAGRIVVRRFTLGSSDLQIEAGDGTRAAIPYAAIDCLLLGSGAVSITETHIVTERKFSLGKTLLAGGIPMTSKVTREEDVTTEERRKYLYLYAGQRPLFLFSLNAMDYSGLGPALLLSQEANFTYLLGELRRRCLTAVYDDRLLNRQALTRLVGPVRSPEMDLDLAAAILARTLRH